MTGWQAILLGIVQGLTEFLPVSSSGHLVLAQTLLGLPSNGIAFEVFAHFGTLLAVITVFRSDLVAILRELKPSGLLGPSVSSLMPQRAEPPHGGSLLAQLFVATVPAGAIGYVFQGFFESTFAHPRFVCLALIVTGLILLASTRAKSTNQVLNLPRAFLIGIAQVIAFFPGISRSGTTITAGMFLGVRPVEAARFSFLLAVPLITGVTVLKLAELTANPPSAGQITTLAVGAVAAYVSGLAAIKWLLKLLERGRFAWFAYYCFAVGIGGLILASMV